MASTPPLSGTVRPPTEPSAAAKPRAIVSAGVAPAAIACAVPFTCSVYVAPTAVTTSVYVVPATTSVQVSPSCGPDVLGPAGTTRTSCDQTSLGVPEIVGCTDVLVLRT